MEHELILPHMEACFAFIRTHESSQKDLNGVLVHCAYGQSRSATICIAYLMQTFKWTLIKAYQTVQRARPCISVNKGFLAQLALFQRMEFDTDIRGNSAAHAEYRTMVTAAERTKAGVVRLYEALEASCKVKYHCKKCNQLLGTSSNQIGHNQVDERTSRCAFVYVEPMPWMLAHANLAMDKGKLICKSCKAKLGSWNWHGLQCSCDHFIKPSFQLVPSRLDQRHLC
ncbi:hypothetical protein ABG067_002383 [Albugo candida]